MIEQLTFPTLAAPEGKRVLKPGEITVRAACSVNTAITLIEEGRLTAVLISATTTGLRHWRVPRESFNAFVNGQPQPTAFPSITFGPDRLTLHVFEIRDVLRVSLDQVRILIDLDAIPAIDIATKATKATTRRAMRIPAESYHRFITNRLSTNPNLHL